MKNLFKSLVIILSIALIPELQVKAEEQIRIVGSSTFSLFQQPLQKNLEGKLNIKHPLLSKLAQAAV